MDHLKKKYNKKYRFYKLFRLLAYYVFLILIPLSINKDIYATPIPSSYILLKQDTLIHVESMKISSTDPFDEIQEQDTKTQPPKNTPPPTIPKPNNHDPFEKYNRAIFDFNWNFYQSFLIPSVKVTYLKIPLTARQILGNFTSNLSAPLKALNFLLQGEIKESFRSLTRFGINSTFGVLGLFDIAKIGGVSKHNTNFDITLATWGVPPGPYFAVPFLLPSSIRGNISILVDGLINPDQFFILTNLPPVERYFVYSLPMSALGNLYTYTPYLQQAQTIAHTSLDFYSFTRQVYFSSLNKKLKGNKGLIKKKQAASTDPFASVDNNTSTSDPFDTVNSNTSDNTSNSKTTHKNIK